MRKLPIRRSGFSLVELMVALAVAAILMVVAAPSFRDLLRRNEVSSAGNALLADLAYARSEAVTRGNIVSICPSTDLTSCTDDTAYESGWIVYTYVAGKGVANTAIDGTTNSFVLRATGPRDNVSIQAIDDTVVSFGPQGQTLPSGQQYKFQTCSRPKGDEGTGTSTNAVPGSELTVNASGSASAQPLGVQTSCTPS